MLRRAVKKAQLFKARAWVGVLGACMKDQVRLRACRGGGTAHAATYCAAFSHAQSQVRVLAAHMSPIGQYSAQYRRCHNLAEHVSDTVACKLVRTAPALHDMAKPAADTYLRQGQLQTIKLLHLMLHHHALKKLSANGPGRHAFIVHVIQRKLAMLTIKCAPAAPGAP